jgi:hypothetical protein
MPREPRSLRDLADYVADNADRITVDGGKPLSKLSTKKALRHMAAIVRSGRMPGAPPPSTSPHPYGLRTPTELAEVTDEAA